MKTVDTYLMEMVRLGGSDVHIPAGCPALVRLHGQLEPLSAQAFDADYVRNLALEFLSPTDQDTLFSDANVDFIYEIEGGPPDLPMKRFRGNAFFQKNGLNLVFRGINTRIPTLQSLGLPELFLQLTHHHHGLVLVVGAAGSGKSSTLAALLQYVNETRSTHIITIEDPIEYVYESKNALLVQRQVGQHVDSFATALRAALREDPDVIMVGEMRDLETISMAITAAETGHLVLGTLHTRSAVQTVQRIIDSFPASQQAQIRTMLSESLRGVVCQQLVPKVDGSGRVAAYELLLTNNSVSNIIREGKDFQLPNLMAMGRNKGMRMMDDSLMELVEKRLVSPEAALEKASDPKAFTASLQAKGVTVA
ncbi:MAG: type IV pilus twitching motility protein PilT [Candidatus Xenobia bacterium]